MAAKTTRQSLWQFCSLAALLLGNCGHYAKPAEIRKYRPKQDHTFLSYSRGNHMGANFRLYRKQYYATAFRRYQTGRNQKCRPKQDHTLISYSCGNHMGANFRLYYKQYYATAFGRWFARKY